MTSGSSNGWMKVRPVSATSVIAVGLRVRVAVADEDDLGAARLHRLHLDRRRRARHDDDGAQPELLRRAGDALGVVAGAGRDDAAGALGGAEVGDLVVGAADLEAEDGLQILALEVHAVAQPRRQPRRELERRLAGDVVDAAGEDPPQQRVEERRPGAGAGRRVLVRVLVHGADHTRLRAASPALRRRRAVIDSEAPARARPPRPAVGTGSPRAAPIDAVAERSALPGSRSGLARSRRGRRRARHAAGRGAGAGLSAAGRRHAAAVGRSARDGPGPRRRIRGRRRGAPARSAPRDGAVSGGAAAADRGLRRGRAQRRRRRRGDRRVRLRAGVLRAARAPGRAGDGRVARRAGASIGRAVPRRWTP